MSLFLILLCYLCSPYRYNMTELYHTFITVMHNHALNLIYCIDKSVLVENRPLVQFIRNYIRDSLVRIFLAFTLLFVGKYSCLYNKKKVTRWLEDMNFIFAW